MTGETFELLPSGVPGLDEVLGGGVPEWSLNLVAGGPGTGKTTLMQQFLFANASDERPALYFTVQGEPPIKMLRYLGKRDFFDSSKVGTAIRFVNLDQEVAEGDFGKLLEAILRWVDEVRPAFVVVDSFRAVLRSSVSGVKDEPLRSFLVDLTNQLTVRQVTAFVLGEYLERAEMQENPAFSMVDNILWLYQSVERNSVVRKLHVVKMRGLGQMPGLHTFKITAAGLEVFPRIPAWTASSRSMARPRARASTGTERLDEMLGGGIPEGDAVLVAGASGTGKSLLACRFVMEGLERGEPAVIAVFEEHPEEYVARAGELGIDLEGKISEGKLKVIYLRLLDLSVDETLYSIKEAVEEVSARRVVIDSVSGFEVALAPTFREDFRESLYRLVSAVTRLSVTLMMTVESIGEYTELRFSPQLVSFLADDIILMRYVELHGQLKRVISVAKMRSSQHSKYMRLYEVTQSGIVVGDNLEEYENIISGMPRPRRQSGESSPG